MKPKRKRPARITLDVSIARAGEFQIAVPLEPVAVSTRATLSPGAIAMLEADAAIATALTSARARVVIKPADGERDRLRRLYIRRSK